MAWKTGEACGFTRDRQRRRQSNAPGVRQRLLARDRAVAAAEAERAAGAGRGERLEAETRQDARRAGVERIGNHERARPLVQRAERRAFLGLARAHADPSPGFTRA
jgi:hypothetical protein